MVYIYAFYLEHSRSFKFFPIPNLGNLFTYYSSRMFFFIMPLLIQLSLIALCSWKLLLLTWHILILHLLLRLFMHTFTITLVWLLFHLSDFLQGQFNYTKLNVFNGDFICSHLRNCFSLFWVHFHGPVQFTKHEYELFL